MRTRYAFGAVASITAAAALLLAPTASADPDDPTAPSCTTTGDGSSYTGTTSTECSTPGNVEINATAPSIPDYVYPWDDEYYGPALVMGPGDGRRGPVGGDGGRR